MRSRLALVSTTIFASACLPAFAQDRALASAPIIYATGALRPASGPDAETLTSRSIPSSGSAGIGAIDLRPGANKPHQLEVTAGQGGALPPVSPGLADPIAGPPYRIEGKWYIPTHEPRYDEIGIASWYGPTFSGKAAASGEVFDEYAMTAAHPTLPIPSMVEVTNLANNRSVTVRVNDRGPFIDDRIIDLSRAAAQALGLVEPGTGRVRVRYLGAAPAEPNTIPAMNGPQAGPLDGQLTSDSAVRSASLPPRSPTPTDPNPAGEPFAPAAVREYADLAGFYVQAGSFADLGNAHALKSDLQSIGPAFITTAMVNGTEFFRVMLGPWPTREDALMTLSRLQVAGGAAIIVSRPPR